jgi:hypothetical protein
MVVAASGRPVTPEPPRTTEGGKPIVARDASFEAGPGQGVLISPNNSLERLPQKSQDRPHANPVQDLRRVAPGRVLEVPAALAHRPLPVFLRHVEVSGIFQLQGALNRPSAKSGPKLSSEKEEQVMQEAERIFTKAMAPAPDGSSDPQAYENWWLAAQERSDNYLRLALGWDRFVTLSREAAAGEAMKFETKREDSAE